MAKFRFFQENLNPYHQIEYKTVNTRETFNFLQYIKVSKWFLVLKLKKDSVH